MTLTAASPPRRIVMPATRRQPAPRLRERTLLELSIKLARRQGQVEVRLISAICSEPRRGLDVAIAGYLGDYAWTHDGCRLLWHALLAADTLRPFVGGLDFADRVWAMDAMCHICRESLPGSWMPDRWPQRMDRTNRRLQLVTSLTWSRTILAELFDWELPPMVGPLAETLLDIRRRSEEAMAHYRRAVSLLRGDDRSEFERLQIG